MVNEKQYQAYLIRFQRTQENLHWRVSMQNANNGKVLRFSTELEFLHHLLNALSIDISLNEAEKKHIPNSDHVP